METKGLAAALVKAQKEMKGAVKDSVNPFFKSKYADLGSVWEACHTALTDNGLSVIQAGSFHDGHFFLKTTLLHSSGESMFGEYLIKPVKDDPQGYGSAWTYARRYSLAAMVGVISEDDDGNSAGQAQVTEAVKQTFAPKPTPDDAIKQASAGKDEWHMARFIPASVTPRGNGWDITDGAGTVYGTLNKDKSAIAEHAALHNKEISISYVNKGKFKSVGKIAESDPQPDREESEVQF